MPKVLLPGYNGFVGKHCAEVLSKNGFDVIGITNRPPSSAIPFVTEEIVCDLSDPTDVNRLSFDDVFGIINLAGIASNTVTDIELVNKINVGAHVNLYKRISALNLNPRIIAVSSGAVYSPVQTMPETEDSLIKTSSDARPYEASKILLEHSLHLFNDMDIVIVRPFNHIGPGQEPGFIVPDLASALTSAVNEGKCTVPVGNLNSRRDYTDVRDVVEAYLQLMLLPTPKYRLYNVCSGIPRSGVDIFNLLVSELGVQNISPEISKEKLRGGMDDSVIYGSSQRLKEETGWTPRIDFETTIHDYAVWHKNK